MNTILSILSGGLSGAVIVAVLRGWLSERLQQSIRHEYSQKLENHKAELLATIEAIRHENQLQQLRTSLFFDHQRNSFASTLEKIAEVNQQWIDKEADQYDGLTGPVPYEAYRGLYATFFKHQLFFDTACLAAFDLILECYRDSLPYEDGSGQLHQRDASAAYDSVEYLQPRLAEIFQNRIGVSTSKRAEREIALLGGIRILNRYHFRKIGLPPSGALELDSRDRPADAVAKAEANCVELVAKLREFEEYLRKDGAFFHEAASKVTRYLEMLLPGPASKDL